MIKKHNKKTFSVNIRDREWKIHLLSEKEFKNKYPDLDADAVTITGESALIFIKDKLTTGVIRHELLHLYVGLCNIDSSGLNSGQTEELIAEIMNNDYIIFMRDIDLIINGIFTLAFK